MKVKIKDIRPNPDNPRFINDDKFKKLVQSIKEFPEMMEIRPIVVNKEMVILGGNMRLKACIEAGLKEVPIFVADKLTEEQEKEFIIKDNVGFGEWDWDILSEWNTERLEDWGLDLFWTGSEFNDINQDELDLDEKFNPIGKSDGLQRVVFLFNSKAEAESYLNSAKIKFIKRNMAWQVDMSTQSI